MGGYSWSGPAPFLLSAVGGTRLKPGVTFAADHFVAVVFMCQYPQKWLYDSSSQSEHQVEDGLLINVVVLQDPALFKLLACENKMLLV